ncbi:cadherin repeat domain-containing protein [Jejuia spongiicola]|uniref:Cadherin repeat domain-containing protein n=1 Tax=Jejuia spongiicola TaxID=2942207 RepID=A0ABT0QAV1_9FLAO|nr:cadherin repeat domain-containing protein [Jejuia spongiicola]MCL6294095.1 cadherin repeat domain-containing protein [Jejuia spongiicola]
MNTIKTFMLLLVIATICACSNDDAPKNNAPVLEDMVLDVRENISSDLITTLNATDVDGDKLTYSIVSQNPANSVTIGETTGEVFVANASAFDYDNNQRITVIIKINDGTVDVTMQLTINIIENV